MRNRFVMLIDVLSVLLSAYGAFALRLDWFILADPTVVFFAVVCVGVKIPVFFAFGLYRRYWRYVGMQDLRLLAASVVTAQIAVAGLVTAAIVAGWVGWFPRSIVFIDGMLTILLVTAVRAGMRALAEERERSVGGPQTPTKHVLIVGAGGAGAAVAREIQRQPRTANALVGFLDDDPAKIGKRIYGCAVLGPLSALPKVVQTYRVSEVVIAMPSSGGELVRRIVDECRHLSIAAKILPGIVELIDGKVSVSRLRNVDIADLLRRSPVSMVLANPAYIDGECVLVTGAGGSIGSELCRQIAQMKPRHLVLAGHGENSIFEIHEQLRERLPGLGITPVIVDIRNRQRLHDVFSSVRPGVVFHAAAHKHVPLMELHPEEAFTNNVIGTANVVEVAAATGAKRLVMISTDKAVAPANMMGASKRLAEMVARAQGRQVGLDVIIVRFGNVLGSRGSVVSTFKRQIENGGPLTITHPDMKRFFMTIPEAVHLVLQAGGIGSRGDLFVLNMGDQVRITQLAEDLIRLSGYDAKDIPMKYTGLRPGEKLEEQLWEDGARVEPVSHPSILRIIEPPLAAEAEIMSLLPEVLRLARDADRVNLDRWLGRVIPTYGCADLVDDGASTTQPL